MVTDPGSQLARWAGEDLAAIATEYTRARELLVPGREAKVTRPWDETERAWEDRVARIERAGRAENARRGRTVLGAAPAPIALAAGELLWEAERTLCRLAGELREHLGLEPLEPGLERAVPADTVALRMRRGTCTSCGRPALQWPSGAWWHHNQLCDRPPATRFEPDTRHAATQRRPDPNDRTTWFTAARTWLARSGIHYVHGDLLDHTARQIRRTLTLLRRVTRPAPVATALRVDCPTCACHASLRMDIGAADRRAWTVRCRSCSATWEWARWSDLSTLLGVDVLAVVHPDDQDQEREAG